MEFKVVLSLAAGVPPAHMRALRLPRRSRLQRFCGAELRHVHGDESDDEVWLRDDVPSKQWLTGAIERGACTGAAAATASACAPALPLPPPTSAPLGSAHVGVHEAEADLV